MLIAGAGGHAKDLLAAGLETLKPLVFYDDITKGAKDYFLDDFPLCKSIEGAMLNFESDARFILGIGGTKSRMELYRKLTAVGGKCVDFIAGSAILGSHELSLGEGLNIMPSAFISNSVQVGKGTLVNTRASLHHDVRVGQFCDIAPAATLLGGARVGDCTFVGTGATVLPGVIIGNHCTIGAGAVVTEDVPDYSTMAGVPARSVVKRKSIRKAFV